MNINITCDLSTLIDSTSISFDKIHNRKSWNQSKKLILKENFASLSKIIFREPKEEKKKNHLLMQLYFWIKDNKLKEKELNSWEKTEWDLMKHLWLDPNIFLKMGSWMELKFLWIF